MIRGTSLYLGVHAVCEGFLVFRRQSHIFLANDIGRRNILVRHAGQLSGLHFVGLQDRPGTPFGSLRLRQVTIEQLSSVLNCETAIRLLMLSAQNFDFKTFKTHMDIVVRRLSKG